MGKLDRQLDRRCKQMNRLLFALTLSLLALPCLGQAPNSATYPVAIHVTRSEVVFISSNDVVGPYTVIDATIDGHKYRLIGVKFANTRFSFGVKPAVLKTGDYKARVTQQQTVNSAQYFRQYELLFTGGEKLKFDVIGESED
jgi:hypothetical protein